MRVILALVLGALAGCATNVPTLAESKLVPAARVSLATNVAPDAATITVIRDSSFAGAAVSYHLLLNGALAAKINSGEFVALTTPPGEALLELRHPMTSVGAAGDSATIQAAPGARYFFRINSDLGSMRLVRTTEDSALGRKQ